MNSFKVMKFSEVELLGNWKLDWSTHGYARYKPRENAIIKIILENGDVKEIKPAPEEPVTMTENLIHIPIVNS